MRKAELLAPAGSYEAFLGAVHAGADAVYLGGQKFSARAYAENFSTEDILRAIRYAHLYDRKVYLTLNTLMKDREICELYDYLNPLYQEGLDGVIVQDIGVFTLMREYFPELALHTSTQMTLTGSYGAKLLKKLGAKRIVPARELSLEELKQIKEEAEIEIETFIHGAMCYCYSGQCLFSSLLGGRSGNRGRCAQPCRLPYQMTIDYKRRSAGTQYPLSLKDMCTIQMLPALIEAGIDSFKIEGRMKKPEYAAGVTALYRRYIDKYYENPEAEFKIAGEDMTKLQSLYIRSDLQNGYYHRHNGAEMITPHKPSYAGADEALLKSIRQDYIEKKPALAVTGAITLKEGMPAQMTVRRDRTEITIQGNIVEKALKQPLTAQEVEKQICRTGNTAFTFSELEVTLEGAVFMPLKSLNELRRKALEQLESTLLADKARPLPLTDISVSNREQSRLQETSAENTEHKVPEHAMPKHIMVLTAEVNTKKQLQAVYALGRADRIYIPSDLLLEQDAAELLASPYDAGGDRPRIYAALPHIIRAEDRQHMQRMEAVLQTQEIDGVLIRNFEALEWLQEIRWQKRVIADANLYVWNKESKRFFTDMGIHMTTPYELNERELCRLDITGMEVPVYGKIPMMITANCIRKTGGSCNKRNNPLWDDPERNSVLTDRYHKQFDVITWCGHCYNIIYNSIPLSLHRFLSKIENAGAGSIRLIFTTENTLETERITAYFDDRRRNETEELPPYEEYTNGHYKRGVD